MAESKEFLDNVKFPDRYESLSLKFSQELNLFKKTEDSYQNLYVFATEYDFHLESLMRKSSLQNKTSDFLYSYICIDSSTGKIIGVDENIFFETFVNTNIISFARSLATYRKNQIQVEAHLDDDEYIHQATETLENQLLEIDPEISTDEESWWMSVMSGVYG